MHFFSLRAFLISAAGLFQVTQTIAQIADPIPESPANSRIILKIESFVQIPASSGSTPKARINHLKPMRDADNRVMVNDLNGPFYVIENGGPTLFLDFDVEFPNFKASPGLGSGFTSFAFHPDFANNGLFYTAHSEDPGSGKADFTGPVNNAPIALQGVVTEWTATDSTASVFAGTKREIMRIDITHTIHGMQEIAFNPNSTAQDDDYGHLYICIGDGGATIKGYPLNTARLDSVLGTILRIDTAGNNSPNGKYGVPAGNPWASDGDPNTIDEIWAYGFRNPHRISWDSSGDGKMLSGDIGERNIEEVNLIEPGNNYGWNTREGTFVINPDFEINPSAGEREEVFELPSDDASYGFTYPVSQYDHDVGRAIVGGFIYRGSSAPLLDGCYLFGDIADGKLYFVDADALLDGTQTEIKELNLELGDEETTMRSLASDSRADIRFGIDSDNELYLLEKRQGMVYKIIGARNKSGGGGIDPVEGWQTLYTFETGDISDWNIDLDAQDTVQVNGFARYVEDPFDVGQGMVLEVNPGVSGQGTHHVTLDLPLPEELVVRDPYPETILSTLYFKVGRPIVQGAPGELDITWGLVSSKDRPSDGVFTYGNYSVLGRYELDGVMDIRDGGSYQNLTFEALYMNVWYEVWYIINHAANTFSQYIKGGSAFPEQTLVYEGATYRNQTLFDLDHLLIITSAGNAAKPKGKDSAYFDDFFMDVSGANLATPPLAGGFENSGNVLNISTRGMVGSGDDVMIGGFIVTDGPQTVFVAARAQELAGAGVPNLLPDPVLKITPQEDDSTVIIEVDNWEDDANQAQMINDVWGGNPPLDIGSTSAAVVITLNEGAWTGTISAADGSSVGGLCIFEVFEVNDN